MRAEFKLAARPFDKLRLITVQVRLYQFQIAIRHRLDNFGRWRCPQIGVEDLHLDVAAIAGLGDRSGEGGEVDVAVAHHAAGQQRVRRQRGDPVADLVADNAWSGTLHLVGNAWFPPQMEGVDHNADVFRLEALGNVQRLGQRGDHAAVRGVDRVHRLDAKIDTELMGVRD